MQKYSVYRELDKIYINAKVEDTSNLKREDWISVIDDDINKVIENNLGCKTVIINKDGTLAFEDEKYFNIPVTDKLRVAIIKKMKVKTESLISKIDLISYISYIDINNDLNSQGIFITDSNREEKYLEILETGDEHLIDLLEEFLLLKDKLSKVKYIKDEFDNIFEKVSELEETDTEALNKLFESI